MSRIENWPPGLGRPVIWVRFRLIHRWSVWHRVAIASPESARLGMRVTDCGMAVVPRALIEERVWRGIPGELCCEVCLRRYLVAKVPPVGSSGGEPLRDRRGLPAGSPRRRRPLNQPSL